jgi:uncharacterized protein YwgA
MRELHFDVTGQLLRRNKQCDFENIVRGSDVLKRKIDTLLESQATIMNAVGSVMCMSEIKDEDLKMKNAIFENLINHRDECMKEVYGESYEELFKTMDKVVNNLGDILDKIFK